MDILNLSDIKIIIAIIYTQAEDMIYKRIITPLPSHPVYRL